MTRATDNRDGKAAEDRYRKQAGVARPWGEPPETAAPSPADPGAPDPENQEALLDHAIEETFPASDPPAITQPTGPTETPPAVLVDRLDQGSAQSFPASDTPTHSNPVGADPPTGQYAGLDSAAQAAVDPAAREQAKEGLSDEQQPSR